MNTKDYYSHYKRKVEELEKAKADAELALEVLLDNSGFAIGTAVEYDGEVYYVFKLELFHLSGLEDEPVFWLTLTKLDSKGRLPKRPLQSKYTKHTAVTKVSTSG